MLVDLVLVDTGDVVHVGELCGSGAVIDGSPEAGAALRGEAAAPATSPLDDVPLISRDEALALTVEQSIGLDDCPVRTHVDRSDSDEMPLCLEGHLHLWSLPIGGQDAPPRDLALFITDLLAQHAGPPSVLRTCFIAPSKTLSDQAVRLPTPVESCEIRTMVRGPWSLVNCDFGLSAIGPMGANALARDAAGRGRRSVTVSFSLITVALLLAGCSTGFRYGTPSLAELAPDDAIAIVAVALPTLRKESSLRARVEN